ncbi:EAL domain-containing protein [Schlegelella sp. S2-27]|uniref:EAL domain-containing protein n=1 Tax=Caldimonas mangrovi TaxID=2944811 RepID=A0ABT0YKT7_9BURK|nr:EAL domain-containing protein [Caldimonas mangrovi]MCM5678827.1 EAL domain-containing protein [Caldimonas mangrovi]
MTAMQNRRILLVDDMVAIHDAFRKVLVPQQTESIELDAVEAMLFGDDPAAAAVPTFELDSAYQGQEGLEKVQAALLAGRPYALAFVDMRMPPGWDGVQTIEELWRADPRLQIVICTAFSDLSWDEVLSRLEVRDRLLILKKPFDPVEISQLASALTVKWQTTQDAGLKLAQLEEAVENRTAELATANDDLRREITERTRNEKELRLAASVFHNTLDGVMIIDPDRRMVSVNQAFAALTGYSLEECLGQPEAVLRSDRQSIEFYQEIWAAVEQAGRWQGELWNKRRDGEDFLAWMNLVKVSDSDGRVERYVGVFHDITEMRSKEERIRHLAFHDTLTGLPNRTLLQDRLEHAITAAQRTGEPLGLMFIDLDRFKSINDSLGHEAGDALLKEVAQRLANSLRKSDTVARLGGDEFVVLLPRVGMPHNYGLVAQKLIEALSKPIILDGNAMQVSASIGIACFPDDGIDTMALMKNADAAMYAAKVGGRGTYRFFQPAMTSLAVERLNFEMQLRGAVANGELELFYQPKISLDSGVACGVEALVRWHHPTLGMIPPVEFIPVAEATGIIDALGDWVLEEACRQLRAWRLAGLGTIKIAVNVSARQLQQSDLPEYIASLAQKYEISACDLEVELTESVLMANPEEISGVLSRLRGIGVLVAIDDFGTGYSSLAYLRRLPIDVLKIDRSFVMNADRDESDGQVVKLILGLGSALQLAIVAEGVETEAQAAFLKSCGCTTAQGYLYARPQPAAQLETWLRKHAGPAAASS